MTYRFSAFSMRGTLGDYLIFVVGALTLLRIASNTHCHASTSSGFAAEPGNVGT